MLPIWVGLVICVILILIVYYVANAQTSAVTQPGDGTSTGSTTPSTGGGSTTQPSTGSDSGSGSTTPSTGGSTGGSTSGSTTGGNAGSPPTSGTGTTPSTGGSTSGGSTTPSALLNYNRVTGADMPGYDLTGGQAYVLPSEEACAKSCNNNALCSMYTYITSGSEKGKCYLKRFASSGGDTMMVKKPGNNYLTYSNTALNGFDYATAGFGLLGSGCYSKCQSDAQCIGFEVHNGTCYFKTPNKVSGMNMGFRQSL
jgi:hypothetical protein